MLRHRLTDEQWDLRSDVFAAPKRRGRPPWDRRQVVDGIVWVFRTGSPWCDLPEAFGPCCSEILAFRRKRAGYRCCRASSTSAAMNPNEGQ